ncbi:hypothetical protein BH23ACT10_BH23ACT10_12980 [soil metagenome]
MNQARTAARQLDRVADDGTASARTVAQLVRCARLSPNAAQTLGCALATLQAHGDEATDQYACQLLRAARARVDAGVNIAGPTDPDGPARPMAWL